MESEINYEIQGFGILLFQVLRAPNSHGRRGVGSGRGGGAGKGILPVSLRQGSGLCAGNMQQCWDVFYKCSLEISHLLLARIFIGQSEASVTNQSEDWE